MKINTVRAILALVIVGTFMFITGFLAIYPLVSKDTNVDLDSYSNFFTKTSSVYTGIIGVIVGYYFAKNTSSDPKPAMTTASDIKES